MAKQSTAQKTGKHGKTNPDSPARPSRRLRLRGPVSPIVLRILAVNLIALMIIVGGIFYLTEFRQNLVDRRLDQLLVQAEILAGAIGESATAGPEASDIHAPEARLIISRLVGPSVTRARLFTIEGELMVDSRFLASSRAVMAEPLPPLGLKKPFGDRLLDTVNGLLDQISDRPIFPAYRESPTQQASDYIEVLSALTGESGTRIRSLDDGTLLLSAAFPVQRFRRVLGALMVTDNSRDIEQIVRSEQIMILKVSGAALAATLLLSIFLASTIARPIRRLALAAEKVRHGIGRESTLPKLNRNDEIGDLSLSLSDMTQALYHQIDAIEAFAADVSHELKNPLSSLRSAVESLGRTNKPDIRERLLAIIQEDVGRLDRLISDISDASRLDAELTRARMEPVDMGALVAMLVDANRTREDHHVPKIHFHEPEPGTMMVRGLESRLGQVVANLLENAISFSPEGGTVTVALNRQNHMIVLVVDDEGPGLPHGAAERIFERFYSERPASEDFGTHSGLGLSISKQIVEAHHGTITAENRFPPLADEKEDAPKGRAKARPKGKGKAKAKTNAKAQKANPAPDPTPEQAAAAQDQPVLGARFQVYLPRW